MTTLSPLTRPHSDAVVYPDSDGMPMADNTLQFEWIATIKANLDLLFADRPDVFVAGDLLWYPVEGNNTIRIAPDALVAFGRPKGYRGSYREWEENNVPPQVVFEIISPGNRLAEMVRKQAFYEQFGVEEYYIYDPDRLEIAGLQRTANGRLDNIENMNGWVSPLLGIRFESAEGEPLIILHPDGRPFLTPLEIAQERDAAQHERDALRQELDTAEQERNLAQQERDVERERAERLAERLRALGVEPDTV